MGSSNQRNWLRTIGGEEHRDEVLQKLESNSKFQTLLMQVKYLSGRIYYTDTEKKALQKWIKKQERTSDIYQFFVSKILEFKDSTRENFEDSILNEVLSELREETSHD